MDHRNLSSCDASLPQRGYRVRDRHASLVTARAEDAIPALKKACREETQSTGKRDVRGARSTSHPDGEPGQDSHRRCASGRGSAYGFGGIGKIIGPVGLALIVGSGNYLKPDAPLPKIPLAFLYLGCWFLMAGAVYYFLGLETRGKSIEEIDRELAATASPRLQMKGQQL